MKYNILKDVGQEFVSKIYLQEDVNSTLTDKFISHASNRISKLFGVGTSSVDVIVNQGEPYLAINVDGHPVLTITNQYS